MAPRPRLSAEMTGNEVLLHPERVGQALDGALKAQLPLPAAPPHLGSSQEAKTPGK